jgi:molybdopterin-biosynthesis enzyme MoeA-like protein
MPPDTKGRVEPVSFGLVAIGDEILKGSGRDLHFAHFKEVLGKRGHDLAWVRILPDDPRVLTDELRFTMSRSDPVLVCGGIGATPDDHTRACAAAAAGVPLERHPQARDLIEGRFGAQAYPYRILMADLPRDCRLIPNPVNQIPGFSVGDHFFLPGFPEMAWPMADWILETRFATTAEPLLERALRVSGVPESRLVPVMRRLGLRYPELKLFSLPHIGDDPYILLGFRGRRQVDEALAGLCDELDSESVPWTAIPPRE